MGRTPWDIHDNAIEVSNGLPIEIGSISARVHEGFYRLFIVLFLLIGWGH